MSKEAPSLASHHQVSAPLRWTWYQSKLNKSWMPWRKYLLITLTKKSPIFKLFTSPISLLYFPFILCLLFPFVPSPTRSSQHFVLFEARASCGSQSAAQRGTRVMSRVQACVVTHLMLSGELYQLLSPDIGAELPSLEKQEPEQWGDTNCVFPCIVYHEEGSPVYTLHISPMGGDGAVCPGTPHKDPQLTKNIS